MKIRCAWCNKTIRQAQKHCSEKEPVTDGICDRCRYELINQGESGLSSLLEHFKGAVVVLNSQRRILAANGKACFVLQKTQKEIKNNQPGVALDCCYAKDSKICGIHAPCKTCRLNQLICQTIQTGKAHSYEELTIEKKNPDGLQPIRLRISCEQMGELVAVKIEPINSV